MKTTVMLMLAVLAVLVMPVHGAAADTARFTPSKAQSVKMESSEVTIRGTSSLHDWKMEGPAIHGSIDTDPEAWRAIGENQAKVTVSIPVASIRSDHKKMDALMQKALKATANPEIKYEMTSATLTKVTGDAFVVRTTGKLTVGGMTRDLTMDVTATRLGDNRYVLTGEAPIRMLDYGIKPPTAMLGTIRTGSDVKIAFRWVVGRA